MADVKLFMFEKKNKQLEYTEDFQNALKLDNSDLVWSFLKQYEQLFGDKDGKTPLHLAAEYGAEKCILIILRLGYPVNQPDNLFRVPLFYALQNKHLKATHLLLDNDAASSLNNITSIDTALGLIGNTYADRVFLRPLLHALLKNISVTNLHERLSKSGKNNFYAAVCSGSETLVKLVNSDWMPSKYINYALRDGMLAAIDDKNIKMIKLMFELGACVNTKSEDGHNLVTYAITHLTPDNYDYIEVIRILLQTGVNINKIYNGLNAVQWAAKCGNLNVLRLLLIHGASIYDKDERGNTLLHLAVHNSDLDVLRYLKAMGLSEDEENNDTITVVNVAKYLKKLEHGQILKRTFSLKD